jgi:hypothetical protein
MAQRQDAGLKLFFVVAVCNDCTYNFGNKFSY